MHFVSYCTNVIMIFIIYKIPYADKKKLKWYSICKQGFIFEVNYGDVSDAAMHNLYNNPLRFNYNLHTKKT